MKKSKVIKKNKIVAAGKLIVNDFIKNYERFIKSIWIIPPSKDEINMIFLIDDTKDIEDGKIDEMKLKSSLIANEIYKKLKLDFIIQFRLLTDYWESIRHGSPVIFSEIRNGISIYDPSGFFVPIKKLLSQGRIPGTKEAMKELISHSPDELLNLQNRIKIDIISTIYDMVVDASQSILIVSGVSPPIPKKIPEYLRNHLVKKELISEGDVKKVENVINFWKDFEHGKIKMDDITSEKLDKLISDTTSFVNLSEECLKVIS